MADIVLSLLEIAGFLLRALLFAAPLTVAVVVFSKLCKRLEKKFRLSWVKAALLSTFAAMALLMVLVYVLPYLGVLGFAKNDTISQSLGEWWYDENGTLVSGASPDNPLLGALYASLVTVLRLAFVSAVLALIILPLEIVCSMLFSRLAKKKSANIVAFYVSTLAGLLIASAAILLFPWIPAGLMYFVFFA